MTNLLVWQVLKIYITKFTVFLKDGESVFNLFFGVFTICTFHKLLQIVVVHDGEPRHVLHGGCHFGRLFTSF